MEDAEYENVVGEDQIVIAPSEQAQITPVEQERQDPIKFEGAR